MQSFDLTLICSGVPGFIRNIGSVLAGKCQLLESYNILEAGQVMQMHDPEFVVVDLRNAGRLQCDRFWALLQSAKQCRCIVVVKLAELHASVIPLEVSARVQVVEHHPGDVDLCNVAAAVTNAMTMQATDTDTDTDNAASVDEKSTATVIVQKTDTINHDEMSASETAALAQW